MPSSSSNAAHVLLLATPDASPARVAEIACAGADTAEFLRPAAASTQRPAITALLISVLLHGAIGLLLWQWIADFQPEPESPTLEVRLRAGVPTPPPPVAAAPAPLPQPVAPKAPAAHKPQPAAHELAKTATTPAPLPAASSQETAAVETPLPSPVPVLAETRPAGVAIADPVETALSSTTLRVLEWLAQHRRYPASARRARMQGTVEIVVVLMPDGRLVNQRIAQSSGHAVLDKAAMDLLRRASPVPSAAFFTGEARQLELRLPIVYQLSI